ncbi:response regulator transcription factor [Bacillus sp. FJAT-47783]|uniref:response regulator transcription factor n=1 Tax=Bacillus sp. FJAT-47783 TaxID=2922712 RepID=UPI001FACE4F2|nr:response regulator transcription factor [Bacillus sp. FJAT-47783]
MIVDDEDNMRNLIHTYLKRAGYTCIEAKDGMEALELLNHEKPDMLIIDIMMPYIDGFTLLEEIRNYQQMNTPAIFLTAKGDGEDKVKGLKLGGDDYIVKPFNPAELLARMEAIFRRTRKDLMESNVETFGPLQMDLQGRVATVQGRKLALTQKEFDLLLFLAKNKGKVFTRSQLLDQIWGPSYEGSERTVDTHIKTIRLKLKDHGHLVETVWGLGYKFEVEH